MQEKYMVTRQVIDKLASNKQILLWHEQVANKLLLQDKQVALLIIISKNKQQAEVLWLV